MTYKEAIEEIAYEFEVGFGAKIGDIRQSGDFFQVTIDDANGFPPKDFEDAAYDGVDYLLGDSQDVRVSVAWDVLSGEVSWVDFNF